ncbi:hypothetical protein KFL_001980220 [Klebsormidium nitens]|uniref:Calcineurin-like phosphoesterase domain-containing protein n=1 Tax=Klebsormidium nitens TaxID=105231 RepID=A0A1Y1I5E4_KLENI|nr:hypothetical protein KFL_001980220 [Klebsormidium nitens]|eukprot:GAQ84639.1 hypothetical protein KFL_001980220 [Klebsormidium nitens]
MFSRFQRFVSRIIRDSKPQAKSQRQQNAQRDLSCHAVAVERSLDELKSRAEGGEGPNGMPLPNPIHAELTPQEVAGRRIILVGDVHGCYDELVLLLDQECRRQPDDVVIFVGDLVNKGPKSPEVVALARDIGAYAVRGNHDDSSLASYYKWANYRSGKGGKQKPDKREWVQQLTEQDVEWLHGLPFSLRIPSHNLLVVHAGLVPGIPLEQQDLGQLYTMRFLEQATAKRKKSSSKRSLRSGYGSDSDGADWEPVGSANDETELWGKVWDGPEHVVFGHDAMRGLQLRRKATGLDTGCVYGGRLTAIILPPVVGDGGSRPSAPVGHGMLVSVKALKEYEKAKGKMR